MEQSVIGAGNRYGYRRALASFLTSAAVQESFTGISYLRYLQDLDRRFDNETAEILQKLNAWPEKLYAKKRLVVSVTGDCEEGLLQGVLDLFPEGTAPETAARTVFPKEALGIVIPSEVGFATKGINTAALGLLSGGTAEVAAQYLTFNYLWNTIRVKGGAYGTGLISDDRGSTGIYSYRDPNPAGSLEAYSLCGAELRAFAESSESIDKYIISTFSNTVPLLTPRSAGKLAQALYFRGITEEDRMQERSEILHTDKAALRAYSETLDTALSEASVCVIAGKSVIDAMADKFDRIENLQ